MNLFTSLFQRRRIDRELSAEIDEHVGARVEDLVESGLARPDAEARARREFGNITASLERSRDTWTLPTVESFFKDILYGLRTLRKRPGFAAVVIVTLALGIGANAAIFGLVDGLWLHPMGVPQPGRIARIFSVTPQDAEGLFSYPEYRAFAEQAGAFQGVVAWGGRGARLPRADGTHELLLVNVVSNNFFQALGVRPAAGRLFDASDTRQDQGAVVLGYTFWQRHFGGKLDVVGRPLLLERDGKDIVLTVTGVLPSTFREVETGSDRDLWMPPESAYNFYGKQGFASRGSRWFNVVGRLAPGASVERARSQIQIIAGRLAKEWPASNAGRAANVVPDFDYRLKRAGTNGITLISVAFLVVLLCCLNVASLLLSRNLSRRTEFAVRLSLGVHRLRLARQLMTENALLGIAGLALGVALGGALIRILPTLFVPPPGFDARLHFEFDARVLIFSVAIALAALVLFGVAPAWRASNMDPAPALKGASTGASAPHAGYRVRRWLVVSQIGISMILLSGSGVLVESLMNARSSQSGYPPKPLLLPWLAGISPSREVLDPVIERIRALPNVKDVALGIRAPLSLSGGGYARRVMFPGKTDPEYRNPIEIKFNRISSNFLQVMGTPIVRGRGFVELDQTSGPLVVLINERLAQRFWPAEDPIGKTIRLVDYQNAEYRVVGLVRNAPINEIGEEPEPYMYLPFWRNPAPEDLTFIVDAGSDPLPLAQPIRRLLMSTNSQLEPFQMTTFTDLLRFSSWRYQVSAELVSSLGLIALLITAVGLYGVVSYNVSRRSREIGIRMALGAERRQTLLLILKEVAELAGWGIVIGLPCSIVAIRLAASMLFGVGEDARISVES